MTSDALIQFFEEGIAFNKHLGMRVDDITDARCRIVIPYQDHLVGDPFRPALHGGVLSALADTAGGLAVFLRVGTIHARVSTVDLRMDYYLPAGKADLYAEASVVRMGNRVGVARIALHQGGPTVAEGKGVYNIARARAG